MEHTSDFAHKFAAQGHVRGYVGRSMSLRAAAAYEEGEKPMSKINAADARAFSDLTGIQLTLAQFKKVLKAYGTSSWHHTGPTLRETYFYSAKAVGDLRQDQEWTAEAVELATARTQFFLERYCK